MQEDALDEYYRKRDAGRTPEPTGAEAQAIGSRLFVVHQHDATRMHFDLRLEHDGVLLCWAVPRGLSRNPQDKRLAVQTEPHPVDYADFEGVIPAGNYGAGAMIQWDHGRWTPLEDVTHGLERGKLLIELRGHKLNGVWALIRTDRISGVANPKADWLVIKKNDAWASLDPEDTYPPESVLSGLTVEELATGGDRAATVQAELAARTDVVRLARAGVLDAGRPLPMLAETADEPFDHPDWLFELKYDGFRVVATREANGTVRLTYRSGRDATHLYPRVVRALSALPYGALVLDAEIVVLDDRGFPSFNGLQQRATLTRRRDIARMAVELPTTLFVFDCLALGEYDVRRLPLVDRKALLQRLVPRRGPLRFAEHIPGVGAQMFAQIRELGLEGVMAKRAASPYRAGRHRDWLKFVVDHNGDFVVTGFTPPKGTRAGFGGLHLAAYDDGVLRYAGRVGSGFRQSELVALRERLDTMVVDTPSFAGPLPSKPGQRWVRPEIVVEVRYKEVSAEGHLRHPVFVRFREDKPTGECQFPGSSRRAKAPPEPPPPAPREVHLTNQDKVFWPAEGYTKGDLVSYYTAIAPWLLPYLADRPVVLTRYPDGIDGKNFFQKDAPDYLPEWIRRERMWSERAQRKIHYLIPDSPEALAVLANLGTIPLHVWSSRVTSLQQPDWCVIDLDPKGAPFSDVVQLALAVGELCDDLGLPAYPKTSGSSGLHVMLPLARALTYEQCRMLAMLLAQVVLDRHHTIGTVARSLDARGGKVYIDTLQNGHGRLIVSPFSVRPKPGAPVSTPLKWDEVGPTLDPRELTIRTVVGRLERMGDPLRPILDDVPDIARIIARLSERVGA